MTHAQQQTPAPATDDRQRWSDFMDIMQEAGLAQGQGQGVSWLIDRMTNERGLAR